MNSSMFMWMEVAETNNNKRCATTMATNVIRIVHVSTPVPPLSTAGPVHVALSLHNVIFYGMKEALHIIYSESYCMSESHISASDCLLFGLVAIESWDG